MGVWSNGTFIKYDDFLNGKGEEVLINASFSSRSTSKKHNVEVCDLVITADTETSHIPVGDVGEYYEPGEVEYLRGMKIKVPEDVRGEWSDFEYFKRKAFGLKIYLSSKGHDIEEIYAELERLFGWEHLLNRADMLGAIIDFLEEERERKKDFENISDDEIGWVYQWSICIYDPVTPTFIYGRTPSHMSACFVRISELLELHEKRKCSIYFHNFAYDYQYIKKWIERDLDAGASPGDEFRLLATAPHKIISWQTTSGIVFKCSYRLSNASLDFWTREIVHTRYKKLVGGIDYDVVRFQDTPLVRDDWRYMIYDVLSQAEAIYKSAKDEGDTMATIPLTSTGYVRRDGRKLYKKDKEARKEFQKTALGVRSYKVLKAAQAGGYTHTNRFIANMTLDVKEEWFKTRYPHVKEIRHGDMRSFYPSKQMCERYPISKFICYSKKPTNEEVKHFLNDDTHCYLFVVAFSNIQIKKGQTLPIISASKAIEGKTGALDLDEDNGRILKATGTFILSLTELDLKLILKQYDIEIMGVLEVWRSRAGFLPEWMRTLINEYFEGKSNFKIQSKLDPKNETIKTALMKSKNRLNGIYGMTATDIVRDSFYEDESGEWIRKAADVAGELEKYFRNANNYMRLAWGVWCTSWSRYDLICLAEIIGLENVLYCDTDSLFYFSNDEIKQKVNVWNDDRYKRAIKYNNYIKDQNGNIITYDVFEDEGENIIKFRALHSKCYAYVTDDNKLNCTIAGVNKTGRVEELGDIDNLKNGFTFHKCGGTTIKYYEEEISRGEIDGHKIEYAGSAIITKVDKTIKYNPYEYVDDKLYLPLDEGELES